MYKVHRGISPEILNDLFPLKQADQYNLRNRSQVIIPNVKTVNHGFESLIYLGPKIWETIPQHLKNGTRIVFMSALQNIYSKQRIYIGLHRRNFTHFF